jgi:hypothetical protein
VQEAVRAVCTHHFLSAVGVIKLRRTDSKTRQYYLRSFILRLNEPNWRLSSYQLDSSRIVALNVVVAVSDSRSPRLESNWARIHPGDSGFGSAGLS